MAENVVDISAPGLARDAGLTRSIGLVALTAAFVNIVVGGGIFVLPGAMAASAGPYAVVAYVICGLATTAVFLCCAEAGSRAPSSGGIYGYVDAAFGPLAGFISGVFLWVGCVLAAGGISAAFAAALGSLVPALNGVWARDAVIVATCGSIAGVNIVSARFAGRMIAWGTAIKLVPLILFVGIGAFFIQSAKLSAGPAPAAGGMGRALLLCLFAFQGMETVLGANGEVKNPGRTLPRALMAAIAICATLYVAIQVVAQGLLGAALAGSAAPLAQAFAVVDPRLSLFILLGTAMSLFAWLGSDILGSPRVLFALSRDGFLPKALGTLTKGGRTPAVAIVVHTLIAIALALTGTFEQLAVLSALASCVLYIGACLAAWRLSRKGVALAGTPLNLKGVPALAVVGSLCMLAAIALARPVEIGATVAMAVVACGLYWIARSRGRA